MRFLAVGVICLMAMAQQPPVPQPPPDQSPPPAQTPPPPPATLVYQGKPLGLTAVCSDAEISDFGLECRSGEPCPVYLELASVEAVGPRLFVSGNLHTDRATLWSLLLASDDDGKTWREPSARIRGAILDQIEFLDAEHGWVSGQSGGALAKDPFLLRTTDGGGSWRRVPLYEEGTPGSIEQFWFDSPAHGALLLERRSSSSGRHQRLETMTGGDTWILRQASAAPQAPLKTKSAAAAEWRVRADGPSSSYRVERRVSGRWSVVAAFAIAAGGCRPAPPKPAEPPAEPPGQVP